MAETLLPHWFQILLSLADEDRHGLGIMNDVLERTGGQMKLWPGMLYRNLAKLTETGLLIEVDAPAGAESGGGRPRFYRITAAGKRACAAQAARPGAVVGTPRPQKPPQGRTLRHPPGDA